MGSGVTTGKVSLFEPLAGITVPQGNGSPIRKGFAEPMLRSMAWPTDLTEAIMSSERLLNKVRSGFLQHGRPTD